MSEPASTTRSVMTLSWFLKSDFKTMEHCMARKLNHRHRSLVYKKYVLLPAQGYLTAVREALRRDIEYRMNFAEYDSKFRLRYERTENTGGQWAHIYRVTFEGVAPELVDLPVTKEGIETLDGFESTVCFCVYCVKCKVALRLKVDVCLDLEGLAILSQEW